MSFSRDLFDENGKIAAHLAAYEIRPQQLQMVEAVEDAIADGKNLIVEAGTGVGKSLAYLVPFIQWAVSEDKRVVISTYTKTLQNQLFVKDLPFLRRVMGLEFRYAMCMGSENYVCLRKAQKNAVPDLFDTKRRKKQVESIIGWLAETGTGLVTDMDLVPDRSVWVKFSRESDLCLGRKCPRGEECFYRKARTLQAGAHILVTNHALLFSDILLADGKLLPEYHGLVLDEAHTLEDVATAHLGREISNAGLRHLLDGVSAAVEGIDPALNAGAGVLDQMRRVKAGIRELGAASDLFFGKTEELYGKENSTVPFDREGFSHEEMKELLAELMSMLFSLGEELDDPEAGEEIRAYAERCGRFSGSMDFIFGQENENYVYWLNVKARKGGTNYFFHAAPIDISAEMRTCLFERVNPIVLTSATLSSSTTGGADFSFIKTRLGLEDPLELLLDSPFDFAKNVLVYLPRGVADPNRDLGAFKSRVMEDIVSIYDIMGGRIFALFTSYDMLNTVADEIADEREDINIMKQGDLPRYVLLDVFKKNNNSILMGTTTFWQGVDVPGSSLECVIITKLPFSVPSDPINAARINFIRERGLNPFYEYQLPQAVIMFKQGFGRLIRHHSDRGVVAVIDPRVRTRGYGGEFIKALPECRQTDDIREVEDFFRVE